MTSPEKSAPKPPAAISPRSPNALPKQPGMKTVTKAPPTSTSTNARVKSSNPPLSQAVLEVLQASKGGKGLTIQAIKKGIINLYPDMQENFSNVRLQKAITKCIEQGSAIRPKDSEEDTGFKGRFLVNKAYFIEKEKEAKQKLKEKQKKKAASDATKKPATLPAKSPSTPQKAEAKSKAGSKKKAPTKTSAKSPKSPKSDTAKAKKATKEGKKTTKSPAAEGVKKGKSPKTSAGAKTAKTPKAGPKTPKSKTGLGAKTVPTPKLSKSATAGARKKTASVRRYIKK